MQAHLTAHARGALVPLTDHEVCRWLWDHLRRAFPAALAVILMPDHLHIVGPLFEGARRRLAAVLGACARWFGLGEIWARVPEPAPLTTLDKVARSIRYIALNCCRPWAHRGQRVQLVPDPLMWPWSTLRDTLGAIIDPWVPAARLAEALGKPHRGFAERIHRYVSSDPHVAVDGTPFPLRAPSSTVPRHSLDDIASAAIACVRGAPADLGRRSPARRVLAGLARDQGWRQPAMVAEMCGIHARNVPRLTASCPPEWVDAAALCLGDARLRMGPPGR